MDDTFEEPLETSNPKTPHFFLCCFGNSGRPPSEKKFMKVVEPEGKRKKRWFSWSRFRIKNSSTKTVPVDSGPLPEKIKSSTDHKTHASKLKVKRKSDDKAITIKHPIPVTNQKAGHQVPARVGWDQASKVRHRETRSGSEQNIILENGKSSSQRRLSFCRKIDAIRTGSSLPGSPEPRTKSTRTVSVTRAASFPTPIQGKPTATRPVNSRVAVRKADRENDAARNQLDSIIGLSILVVTLIVMVFWGRLCAILCTSAWFYFIPRLRTGTSHNTGENGGVKGEPDFNSEAYKKRVVLEGFLERRTHRSKP